MPRLHVKNKIDRKKQTLSQHNATSLGSICSNIIFKITWHTNDNYYLRIAHKSFNKELISNGVL